jgi:hypothetical protein
MSTEERADTSGRGNWDGCPEEVAFKRALNDEDGSLKKQNQRILSLSHMCIYMYLCHVI